MELQISVSDYDILEPLEAGDVRVENLDVNVETDLGHAERYERIQNGELDAAEFTIGAYIAGWPEWDFTAIPAFPRRFFPHSRVFVNKETNIRSLEDLEGAAVGIRRYANTPAIWLRGILSDQHDIQPSSVDWHVAGPDRISLDEQVDVETIDEPASTLLNRGALDAVVAMPQDTELYSLENVRPMYEDPRAAEREYYEDTGYYPSQAVIVVRDELLHENDELASALMQLFRQSREVALERELNGAKHPLVWWRTYREIERDIFGDIWTRSFEFAANAEEVETLIRYCREQGLNTELFAADDLFVTIND